MDHPEFKGHLGFRKGERSCLLPTKTKQTQPSATLPLQRIVKGSKFRETIYRLDTSKTGQGLHRKRGPANLLKGYNVEQKCQYKWEAKTNLSCWSQSFAVNNDQTWLGRSERFGFAHFLSKVSKTRSKLVERSSKWSERQVVSASCLIMCKSVTSLNLNYFICKSKLQSPLAASCEDSLGQTICSA